MLELDDLRFGLVEEGRVGQLVVGKQNLVGLETDGECVLSEEVEEEAVMLS